MKRLVYTQPGGYPFRFAIRDWDGNGYPPGLEDYETVSVTATHNAIRRHLGIIRRYTGFITLHDFAITFEHPQEYRLWVYSRNWQGRAGYYAGMIRVRDVQTHQRKLFKLRQRSKP